MPKKKTIEDIKNMIESFTKNEFTVEGEYINKTKPITIVHRGGCGKSFKISHGSFINELKCRCCGYKYDINLNFKVHSESDFEKAIPKEYRILEFKDVYSKCKLVHKKCGHVQDIIAYKFLINNICLQCKGGHKKNDSDIKYEMHKLYNGEFVLFDDTDATSNEYVTFFHTKCKREFYESYKKYRVLQCSKCKEDATLNTKKFKKLVSELTYIKKEFELVGVYKNIDSKTQIKHKVCGLEFDVTPNAFIKTPKCPLCENLISKGEKVIGDVLKYNKIKFDREFKIEGCSNINTLSFDLAVFDSNGDLYCLIEYDGEQHYFPIMVGAKDSFKDIKTRDEIKNKYCKDNNIKLIRIPYWDFNNIESIIKKEIIKHMI